jgi:hypothetical protein
MFAAINAESGEESLRGGETAEAQGARVAATYERALHRLRAGARDEAQGAPRHAPEAPEMPRGSSSAPQKAGP